MVDVIAERITALGLSALQESWYLQKHFFKVVCLFECLEQAGKLLAEALESERTPPPPQKDVHALYMSLHEILVGSSRALLPAPPEEHALPLARSPLSHLCAGMACCLDYLRQINPPEDDDPYYRYQRDIGCCAQHGLVVALHARICDFTYDELLTSIQALETSSALPYTEELSRYVQALELRAGQLALYAWDSDVLNTASARDPYLEGSWVLTAGAEFELACAVASMHRRLRSALPSMRRDGEAVPPDDSPESARLTVALLDALQSTADTVYGDEAQRQFSKYYCDGVVSGTEALLFLKENGAKARVEPSTVVRQFRGVGRGYEISERSEVPFSTFIEDPGLDLRGFAVAFWLAARLLFAKTLHAEWNHYYVRAEVLTRANYLKDAIRRSRAAPLFVETHHEAALLFDGVLYLLGPHPYDYARALLMWAQVVQARLDGHLDGGRLAVAPFLDALFGNRPAKRARAAVSSEPMVIFTRQLKDLAFYERVRSVLSTNDSVEEVGELVGSGFGLRERSAWCDL